MKELSPKRGFLLAGILLLLFTANSFAQCPVPTNLHITNLTSTSGLFLWNTSTNSTSYVLKVRPVGTSTWRRIVSGNNSETVTGLIPNTNYEAKVRSDCSGTEGNYTSYYYFTTSSNNPCQLPNVYYFTSDNITANSCRVGWHAVTGATGYNVQWRIRYSNSAWTTGNTNTTYLDLTGLNPLTQYEFEVQTLCSAGSAAYSSFGIFTTHNLSCNPPTGLSVSNVTDSTADLLWSAVSCAAYYNVQYRISGQNWSSGDTTSFPNFSVHGLTAGSNYEFKVLSVISSGSLTAYSQAYSFATSNSSCGQPVNLTTTDVTTSGATLAWTGIAGATSYNVRYRLAGASTWQSVTTTNDSITVTGLTSDNAYEFQVQSICGNGSGSYSSSATFITDTNPISTIPVPDHIVICVMENKAYNQIFGGSLTPRINALGSDSMSAVFTESYGKTHPSQPNYLHLFSGSNQGVTNNAALTQKFNTPNLARELLNAGHTFVTYADGLPSVGYDGEANAQYRRRHNPVTNWMGTGTNQIPSTLNQPFTSFPTNFDNLPTVSYVIPDLNNDMHDGALGTALANGDSWFYNNLNAYIQWAKTHNSLFILTTDEDDGSHGNRVLTIFTGEMIAGGVYSQPINHTNVLRTICEMYGLNFIAGAASVNPIHGCWTTGFRQSGPTEAAQSTPEDRSGWRLYPNPSRGELHIAYELEADVNVAIRVYNSTGALMHERKLGTVAKGKRVYDLPGDVRLSAGVYFVSIEYGDKKYVQRLLVSE